MVMRLRYFTISGAQFTAFRVYNTYKSYCKFNFNMQSLEFLRLSPLCFKRVVSPTPGVALFNLAGSGSLLALFAAV